MTRSWILFPAVSLFVLIGCGGSVPLSQQPKTAPSAILYTDPTGEGWRLVKDTASTPTHLLLNVIGPSGTMGRGVSLNVSTDCPDIRFTKFKDGRYIKDMGVFQLYQSDPNEPKLMIGGVREGKLLLGIFQKDYFHLPAKDCGAPLLQFGIEVNPETKEYLPMQATLTISKALMLPEDVVDPRSRLEPITISLGTLTLK